MIVKDGYDVSVVDGLITEYVLSIDAETGERFVRVFIRGEHKSGSIELTVSEAHDLANAIYRLAAN